MAIEAEHYEETRRALMADPIIIDMAVVVPKEWDCGSWSFMQNALALYKKRGGTIPTHIGGPAEAIERLVKAREG